MQLIGRYLSPFVRRVATTLGFYGIPFEHVGLQHTGDDVPKLRQINPLGRVPALVLDDGEVIVESAVILDYLDREVGPERALTPAAGHDRTAVMMLTAMATGAVEKAISVAYESRFRPKEMRHAPWVDRCSEQSLNGFSYLNDKLTGEWLHGGRMTQADLTAAVCWQFVGIATPKLGAALSAPNLDALVERMLAQKAFADTVPKV